MDRSLQPGKMTASVDAGVLIIQRRTYRSADFVHVIFSMFAAVFAILFLVIAVSNGTLFDGFATPIVILALIAYAYFGVTRIVDRRTVTVTLGRITARDGPLPLFMRTLDTDVADYGDIEVRSATRYTFPLISKYRLHYVGGEMAPDLFRRLRERDEAEFAAARISVFLQGDHN